jgi:hemerythrin-like domain-containing protein
MSITAPERLTSTSLDLPPDLYGYAGMHLGMHRDAARLERTLQAGPRDAAALARWWQQFRDVIVRHHQREDDLIWPAIAAADPTFAADIEEMHDDHAALDAAMERVDRALTSLPLWEPMLDEARAAAAAFRQVLADHLAREEEVAFHRLAAHPRMWAEVDEQIVREVTVREAAWDLPWLHDGMDRARSSYLMGKVPAFARPLVRWLWQPRYARLVAAAHGAAR